MLLTITNTQSPATDLGYLLHKNPDRPQSFDLSFGRAHIFYPKANDEICSATLLLEVDPVGLVRNRRGPGGEGRMLEQYVNDRPYVASSFLSVAIAHVFGSALSGRSRERQSLVEARLPLKAAISVLPCRGGEEFLRKLFEPLGYVVSSRRLALDEKFPEWGESQYFKVELQANCRLRDLLSHLYVLIPVLDNDKHYWVGDDEVEKLLRHGASWLSSHPERGMITRRYLKYRHSLVREALARLVEEDADAKAEEHANEEAVIEERISLNAQRINSVLTALKDCGARRVVDLGCGEGNLLRALLDEQSFTEIVGVDVSYRALEIARDRLKLDRLPQISKERIRLMQGSLTYRDKRLAGYDAATVIEVIEHLDHPRLSAFERVLFEFARPGTVVVTTPNIEYNVRFENLPAGQLRHRDHRFEWTRSQFQQWSKRIAEKFGYYVRFAPIGPEDEVAGAPTQMAVFSIFQK